ncbi:MAG: FRG domain-containing protein [Dehalococcoidia bacterium]|nr:FRG domain-containing protein [Dehalococcoidia bacterium]
MWYRGLSDAQYQLDSTLKRSAVRPAMERALVNRFKQNAGSFLSNPPTDAEEWEWMFIMRHHGAPSRLLDWSESPLVGLYFAAQEPHGRRKDDPPADGALWILLPEKLNARANIRSAGATDIPSSATPASPPKLSTYTSRPPWRHNLAVRSHRPRESANETRHAWRPSKASSPYSTHRTGPSKTGTAGNRYGDT